MSNPVLGIRESTEDSPTARKGLAGEETSAGIREPSTRYSSNYVQSPPKTWQQSRLSFMSTHSYTTAGGGREKLDILQLSPPPHSCHLPTLL